MELIHGCHLQDEELVKCAIRQEQVEQEKELKLNALEVSLFLPKFLVRIIIVCASL